MLLFHTRLTPQIFSLLLFSLFFVLFSLFFVFFLLSLPSFLYLYLLPHFCLPHSLAIIFASFTSLSFLTSLTYCQFMHSPPSHCLDLAATGEPALCFSYVVVTALRHAIAAFRAENGNEDWFEMRKFLLIFC